jgi:GT2 family glycosyltransferase
MHVLYHGYLPNTFLYTKKNPAFIAANGQIMLFREECYHSIGGHEAVKSSLVEDIDIARALKKKGGKVVLANAVTIVSCSMYDGFNEVLRGFSKNFYPGFQEKTIPYIFFMLHVFTGYVLPLIVSIIAIITNAKQLLYVSLFALFLGMVIRSLSTIQFRLPLFHVLLQPFSALFAFIIGINSFLWSRPGKGRIWKERKYS